MSKPLPFAERITTDLSPDCRPGQPLGELQWYPSAARLRRLVLFVGEFWWIPSLCLGLCLAGAGAYIAFGLPTYVSTAMLWETEKVRLPEGAVFTADLQNYLGTQIDLLRSEHLFSLAMQRLKCSTNQPAPDGRLDSSAKMKIRVRPMPRSSLVAVDASSSVAADAQEFLQCLVNEYESYTKNVRNVLSGNAYASVSARVGQLARELDAEQMALTAFEQTNNVAMLEEEAKIVGGYLTRLRTQLSDFLLESNVLAAANFQLGECERELTNAGCGRFEPSKILYPSASPVGVSERQAALKEFEVLRIQRETLSKFMRPKHPRMVKLEESIEQDRKLLWVYHRQNREQLASSQQALELKEASVQLAIRDWQENLEAMNYCIGQIQGLKQRHSRTQALHDRLALLLENLNISRDFHQEGLAILQPAGAAVRSYRSAIVASTLAVVLGLGMGMGIVFFLELRDDRFMCLEDIAQLSEPVLAHVPDHPHPRHDTNFPVLNARDGQGSYADSFRHLRSALLFMATDVPRPKILLITSALPREGKSTIALNLARTLAAGGSRVLLVDVDLNNGNLHELMDLPPQPGFAELLSNPEDINSIVLSDSQPNLWFLARGASSHYSGDQLLSPRLPGLFDQWRAAFDLVVLDGNSVHGSDEALTLAARVDATLLVVRNRFSRASIVTMAIEKLSARQARVLGLVFNGGNSSLQSASFRRRADRLDRCREACLGEQAAFVVSHMPANRFHVLFLTHYFPPEGNAPATRVFELCRRWVKHGIDVTVITGAPNVPNGVVYAGYKNRICSAEDISGIHVIRLWTYLAPNKGTFRRILNYLSFMVTGTIGSGFVRRPDIVIATSPQFFCGWAGAIVSFFRRCPFILEIRDIWPDSIEAVGITHFRILSRLLRWPERRLYALADRVVTVGEGYRRKLIERQVLPAKLAVVTNGVDREYLSNNHDGAPIRKQYGLERKFICSYVGTVGMAHGLEIVVRAAVKLKAAGRSNIAFMIVGDGAERQNLANKVTRLQLENVILAGLQPKERVPAFIAASDVCLVHLRNHALFRTVLPSKIFEALAMARPVILGVEGSAAEFIKQTGGGVCIEPDNEDDLLRAIERLAQDPVLVASLGKAGKDYVLNHYDRDALSAAYLDIIDSVQSYFPGRVAGGTH